MKNKIVMPPPKDFNIIKDRATFCEWFECELPGFGVCALCCYHSAENYKEWQEQNKKD